LLGAAGRRGLRAAAARPCTGFTVLPRGWRDQAPSEWSLAIALGSTTLQTCANVASWLAESPCG